MYMYRGILFRHFVIYRAKFVISVRNVLSGSICIFEFGHAVTHSHILLEKPFCFRSISAFIPDGNPYVQSPDFERE